MRSGVNAPGVWHVTKDTVFQQLHPVKWALDACFFLPSSSQSASSCMLLHGPQMLASSSVRSMDSRDLLHYAAAENILYTMQQG